MNPVEPHPVFAGICGPSGCGKSTLAQGIVRLLGEERCGVLPLDAFYRDLSALAPEEREHVDFDRPEALDEERLRTEILCLSQGEPARIPVYDFSTHARAPEPLLFSPRPLLLIEGIFVFSFDWLLPLLTTRIYLDLDADTCLEWRIARDTRDRSRTEEEIRTRFERDVRPAIEKRVLPQKALATRVLDAKRSQAELLRDALREIARGHGADSRIVPAAGE